VPPETIPKRFETTASTTASTPSLVVPYTSLTVGIPRETFPNERRVAITPQNVALLLKKGFSRVIVESGAGEGAQFTDEAYRKAGAIIAAKDAVWSQSDILLKVRAPSIDEPVNEVNAMREGTTIISFLYPAQNKPVVDALAARGLTSFAMDKIPRISRAQVFDALR
jgi:NAD(P) transhydrogenase